jgi:hypothetical protein
MRPDEAKFLLRFLLPQLKSEQTITKKILNSVPPDQGDYKPHADSMSALKLAWHLAVVEIWFLEAVIYRHFGETAPMPAEVKTGRHVAEWYDETASSVCRVWRRCPARTLQCQLTSWAYGMIQPLPT